MERPIFKPVGTPAEDLDTPALVVDIDILDSNIETVHSFFRNRKARLRPHIEAHRTPAIAHKQLAAGGTVGGISVTTLGQAEVFAESGFPDISVANVVVTPEKIMRLCYLARRVRMTVAVDSAQNVRDLSEAASAAGVTLNVVVYVHTRQDLLGVEPGQPAVDLARDVSGAGALRFAGLMTYEGAILAGNAEDLAAESRKWIQQVLDTRESVENAGIEVSVVSVGGTHNYEIAGAMDGVTEIPAGSYALMDHRYRDHRKQLEPAASIIATVGSVPEDGVAVTDGGQKAIGADTGLPSVDNIPGADARALSAEHGNLLLDTSLGVRLGLGDKVWLTPWDIGECVNLHDYMYGIRNGRLEVVWDVLARGHYR